MADPTRESASSVGVPTDVWMRYVAARFPMYARPKEQEPRRMRVEIVSGGTAGNTVVRDVETGAVLDNVCSVSWTCDVVSFIGRATLELILVPATVLGETWAVCEVRP